MSLTGVGVFRMGNFLRAKIFKGGGGNFPRREFPRRGLPALGSFPWGELFQSVFLFGFRRKCSEGSLYGGEFSACRYLHESITFNIGIILSRSHLFFKT